MCALKIVCTQNGVYSKSGALHIGCVVFQNYVYGPTDILHCCAQRLLPYPELCSHFTVYSNLVRKLTNISIYSTYSDYKNMSLYSSLLFWVGKLRVLKRTQNNVQSKWNVLQIGSTPHWISHYAEIRGRTDRYSSLLCTTPAPLSRTLFLLHPIFRNAGMRRCKG